VDSVPPHSKKLGGYSETWVTICWTTQRHIAKDSNYYHRRNNLKSHIMLRTFNFLAPNILITLFIYLFTCLFISGLFKNSDYIASYGRMITKLWIRKYVEASLIWSTILSWQLCRGSEESHRNLESVFRCKFGSGTARIWSRTPTHSTTMCRLIILH
jgi:hypothetical protein